MPGASNVTPIDNPGAFWSVLDRILDERGVPEASRPAVRELVRPLYERLRRPPAQRKFTVALPPTVLADDVDLIQAEIQRVVRELEDQHRRTELTQFRVCIELAIQLVTD